jgi:hypothetical protein
MKLTKQQAEVIQNFTKNYLCTVIDYGFYSNGDVSIKWDSEFGIGTTAFDRDGIIVIQKL